MQHQMVMIIDFGGQYNQLIARRVRECGVYCEVIPYRKASIDPSRRKILWELFSPAVRTAYISITRQA